MKYSKPLNDESFPGREGAYVNANPALGIPGSTVPGEAIEHPMREIINAILGAGLEPGDSLTQLLEAIRKTPSEDSNRVYEGQDLTDKFANEIADYDDDPWAWIKARITSANFAGLNIADYIPFMMNGHTIKAQIAGIDTYYRTGDLTKLGHHIDFISKDCYPEFVKWNNTNVNNGSAANAAPWMVSGLKSLLNSTWYNYLPLELQAQIVEKRVYIEERYSASSTLIDSTRYAPNNIGKLWVPLEYEIHGSVIYGTKGHSAGNGVQYPIFANSFKNKVKLIGEGGEVASWWSLCAYGGMSTSVCHVSSAGMAAGTIASRDEVCAPVCFRIA